MALSQPTAEKEGA